MSSARERVEARQRVKEHSRADSEKNHQRGSERAAVSNSSGTSRTPVDGIAVPFDTPRDVSRTVLVASDVRLYSEGLALVFAADGRLRVSQIADTAARTLSRVAERCPDAVLLDAAMTGVGEIVRAMHHQVPRVPVVLFGVPALDEDLFACIDAGVATFVSRDASPEDLIEALLSAMRSESSQSRSLATVLARLATRARVSVPPTDVSGLTARERELAALLDEGLTNKEIAQRLHISVATVKNHVHRILEKLHVRRRGQAASRLRPPIDPRI